MDTNHCTICGIRLEGHAWRNDICSRECARAAAVVTQLSDLKAAIIMLIDGLLPILEAESRRTVVAVGASDQ